MFYFILGQRSPHYIWTWSFVLYIGHKPIIDDICIWLFVLGVDPKALDWWDFFCWEKRFGALEWLMICVEQEALEHMSTYLCVEQESLENMNI